MTDLPTNTNPLAIAMPPGFERARVSVKVNSENFGGVMTFVAEAVRNGVPLFGPDDPPPMCASLNLEHQTRKPNLNNVPHMRDDGLRTPRKPTLASVARQVSKAGIEVARYEIKPDGSITIVTGKPESAAPDNSWPLDEFRTKETKQ